jgi:hypothetical protein
MAHFNQLLWRTNARNDDTAAYDTAEHHIFDG